MNNNEHPKKFDETKEKIEKDQGMNPEENPEEIQNDQNFDLMNHFNHGQEGRNNMRRKEENFFENVERQQNIMNEEQNKM